jgi:hypothetical protein
MGAERASMNDQAYSPGQKYGHFGEALQAYRESVSDRLRQINPRLPRMQLSAASLIEAMRDVGYSISPGAYSEIEAGNSLPRDPRAFLDAVSPPLAIERDSLEWWILQQNLARDLVSQKLGPIAAEWVLVDEDELRRRVDERQQGDWPR